MPRRPDFDLYEALEVSSTATLEDIRVSYRRLALIHHPDKNPGDAAATERFQRINAAYEYLSDATGRHAYDNPSADSQIYPHNSGQYYEYDPDGEHDFDEGYTGGYTYSYFSFEDFLHSRTFRENAQEHRRHSAARSREQQEGTQKFMDRQWQQQESYQRGFREEKRRKDKEAEAARQAKLSAKKLEEEEKQRAKDMKAELEKEAQERRWSYLNAMTVAEKRSTCLHAAFWPKQQQKRKFKCESCGKKSGLTAYKCPHCSLLACQVCLQKLAKTA